MTGGICVASFAAFLGSPSARAVTWDGGGIGNNWAEAINWNPDTAPVSLDSLVFTQNVRLAATNNLTAATQFSGISFASSAGSFTLSGNSVTLGGDITNSSLNPEASSIPLVLNASRNVNVSSRIGNSTLSGVISGATFGLTKTGLGQSVLSGANTFTGPVTVSAGTLSFAADSATGGAANQLGATPGATTAGAVRLDGGTLRSTATTQLATVRGIALGNAGGGGGTIDVDGGTLTYNGVMANNGGTNTFAKTGLNQLTLGGVSTYTGATNINLGTLRLDFTQIVGTTTNIINSASALVLGGVSTAIGNANNGLLTRVNNIVTLGVTSKSAANSVQAFNGLTLNAGNFAINTTQTAAGTVKLALGGSLTTPEVSPIFS